MDNALIYQIIGGILAIVVCVLTYFSTKSWRWPHVTMMFFVVCAAVTFTVYAAMAAHTRMAWIQLHDEKQKEVEVLQKQVELLTYGAFPENPATVSVVRIREEVARAIIDRGRVWRGCVPTVDADGSVNLAMAVPAPAAIDPAAAAAAPAVAKSHGMEVNTVLHAFKEMPNAQGLPVPSIYLGEFQAKSVAEGSIVLVPNLPLGAFQLDQVNNVNATWMLYEVAPPDAYEALIDLTAQDLTALIPLLPIQAAGVTPEEYQKMYEKSIDDYVRHGKRANDDDAPENLWMRVKFKKSHEIVVDAATSVSPVDDRHFDAEGKAQVARLMRQGDDKGPVKFEPGMIAIFDVESAKKLVDEGIVEKQELVFARKLHDYESEYQTIYHRMVELGDRIVAVQRDTATVKEATVAADGQIKVLQDVETKISADLVKVKNERDGTKRYAEKLAAQVATIRQQLSQLYRSNKALGRELAEVTARLTDEINARTKQATAMATPSP